MTVLFVLFWWYIIYVDVNIEVKRTMFSPLLKYFYSLSVLHSIANIVRQEMSIADEPGSIMVNTSSTTQLVDDKGCYGNFSNHCELKS